MRYAFLGILLFVAACASQIAETPAQRVFALQADFNAILSTAVVYTTLERCAADEIQPCSNQEVVDQIRRAAQHARDALRAAQNTVRANEAEGIGLALTAAREAVAALSTILGREGLL